MRTICELSTLPGTVYVSLPTRQAQALFLRDALDQGLTFADGQAPTNQAPWNFYRLDPGPTICYAGRGFCAVQKMALVCRGAVPGELAVEYLRYRACENDYILPHRVA